MSQVRASSESVRQLAQDLKKTSANLKSISDQVKSTGNVSGWNDAQGAQFSSLVKQIAALTQSPIETLEAAIPRLNKIADVLEQYSKIKF